MTGKPDAGWNELAAPRAVGVGVGAELERVRSTVKLLALLGGVAASITIVLARSDLLPDRFSYDGLKINRLILGYGTIYGDESYQNVAAVYAFLGFGGHPMAAGMLGITGALGVTGLVCWKCRASQPTVPVSIFLFVSTIISGVYLGFYTKDVFILPIVGIVIVMERRVAGDVVVVSAMIGYAVVFRNYWLLVALAYMAFRVVLKRRFSVSAFAITTAAGLLIIAGVAFAILLRLPPDYFRALVNQNRIGDPDAQSIIQPFLEGSALPLGIVNVGLTLIFLILPLPLLGAGTAYYWIIAVLLGSVWCRFFLGIAQNARAPVRPASVERAVCLVGAFVLIQAFFEPDYGSALRHLSPLLILMLYVAWTGSAVKRQSGERNTPAGHAASARQRARRLAWKADRARRGDTAYTSASRAVRSDPKRASTRMSDGVMSRRTSDSTRSPSTAFLP